MSLVGPFRNDLANANGLLADGEAQWRVPTHLIVFFHPDNQENALSPLREGLKPEVGTAFAVGTTRNDQDLDRLAKEDNFKERWLTLVLTNPLTEEAVIGMADLVRIGLICGFVVRGEVESKKGGSDSYQQLCQTWRRCIMTQTYLIVFLHPEAQEHALYLLGEALKATQYHEAETAFTVVEDAWDDQNSWGGFKSTRLTLALAHPLTEQQVNDVTRLVLIGTIRGFLVQGEIVHRTHVVNNLNPSPVPKKPPIERKQSI